MRTDRLPGHRSAYNRNRKRIFASQNTCAICGYPVDFSLKAPNPMSAVIDHIVPVAKGGHPSDINNLQLAHWTCNRQKSDKLFNNKEEIKKTQKKVVGNRNLPQSKDWISYRLSE
ncbi:HNH endonuclease [Facklamia hominis]|uniref:HNH endonuclease signature motif containing protein n=1 Tax=Facklamia hominis TaxID=178214 RepID=A0AAJ1Q4U3_9LACT|nr:HNH endonuclease signature motif containing protein [Facklamia hominis]MDK7186869.1 HNH endonuclease signature motif containing protein [Facklamia hominis]